MAKIEITTAVLISRPVAEVSAFAADPDNATGWYANIKSVEWKTEKPLRAGSQIAFKARFLGKDLEYVYEVVEMVPGRRLTMRTAQGPFPMETRYQWVAMDERSPRMPLRNAGFPRGFSKLMAPFMAYAMRKANEKDLRLLKNILEDPAYRL